MLVKGAPDVFLVLYDHKQHKYEAISLGVTGQVGDICHAQ